MRELRRLAWAAAFAAFAATPAVAQTTSTVTGGTSVGGTGTTLGNTGGNAGGGTGSGGNSLGGTGQGGGTELLTFPKSPNITPVSAYTTTNSTNTGAQASNFLRNTFGNPYYQGRYNATVAQAPGGFGAALYPATTTTTTQGGRGGRGGQGGLGAAGASGSINVQDPGGIIGTLPRQISYTSVVKFSSPAIVPAQLQSELSGMISRTTMIANPAGVQVVMTDGTSVILRGTVRDSEEARTVEGMVRMTPGVRQIKNELTFPKQP